MSPDIRQDVTWRRSYATPPTTSGELTGPHTLTHSQKDKLQLLENELPATIRKEGDQSQTTVISWCVYFIIIVL